MEKIIDLCESDLGSWTSAGMAISNVARFLDEDISLVEVMGYTGHAFRININAEDVDVAGPTAYDWEQVFKKGLENLGFTCKTIRTKDFVAPTPSELKQAIKMIQESIDQGIPAISWDMFVPEFGVIYGYDDDKQEFMVKDPNGEGPLAYEKLGRGQINEMFVATVTGTIAVDRQKKLKGALEMAIEHAKNREHKDDLPPYENGLKGYDAWIQAFENGKVSEFGNSYNLAVVRDARRFAVQYFNHLKGVWADVHEVQLLAEKAANHYQTVVDHLSEIVKLYPFPSGGEPKNKKNAEFTISQLKLAKEGEKQAVKVLEELLEVIK